MKPHETDSEQTPNTDEPRGTQGDPLERPTAAPPVAHATTTQATAIRLPRTVPPPLPPAEAEPRGTLQIAAWPDPLVDKLGHDPRSQYVERFWLPILGPSTCWLLRRLADGLDARPDGYELDLGDTARALGLGKGRGRNAPFARAIRRTTDFGLARHDGKAALGVRRHVPPLTAGQIRRLPAGLQAEHTAWISRPPSPPSVDELRTRARRLALSLVELGEDREGVERQLHRWRFHPAMTFDAAKWAFEAHTARSSGHDATAAPDRPDELPPSA